MTAGAPAPEQRQSGAGEARAPGHTHGCAHTFALQRFRGAMDASADALFLIDAADLSIIDVSDGACRMLGYSRAALLGADPVWLGLGAASELHRRARRPVDAGTKAELADAELRCADPHAVVAVEISWQVQVQGGVRTLIALARELRQHQRMAPRQAGDAQRGALALALRGALERDEFVLYFQPKMTVRTGSVSGMEALLRWQRPGHGLVLPNDFVAVMEETGLIVRVGAWVIDAACRQIAAWNAAGIGEMRVAVNVSSRQFVDGDLEAQIRGALERHRVDGRLLELELTESALMVNPEHAIAVLGRLKLLGIQIAIDDFGTGYSSLAYLQRLPIDKLKIDIAFVRDIATNAGDGAIAEAIIRMAHSLRMVVIAEGVETPAQLAYLAGRGCDQIQGYYFSAALPAEQVVRMVLANRVVVAASAPLIAPAAPGRRAFKAR